MKIGLRSGVRLLSTAALLAAVHATALAQEGGALTQTLKEGIDLLERGRTEEANKKFREVLAADPSSDDAYALLKATSSRQILDMLTASNESRQVAERLLKLSHREEVKRSSDEAAISALVSTLVNTRDLREQEDAANKLAWQHGEFAVPALLPHLGSNDIDTRAAAVMALRRIGSDAVMPLAASLGTGSEMQQRNVASLLGGIGDKRGMPALLKTAKSGPPLAAAEARKQLEAKGVRGGEAAEAYMSMARRFFDGDPLVLKNYDAAAVVWSMKDGKLTGTEVPHVVYQYELAEQAAFDALALSPGNPHAEAMIALCAVAEQVALGNMTPEAKGAEPVQNTAKMLEGATALANSTVVDGLMNAFILAAEHGHAEAAMRIAEVLPGVWGDRAVDANNPLVKALAHEDRGIRYAAALALLRINPSKDFPGSKHVAMVAGQAAAEAAVKQVLVLDSDAKNAANVQRALNEAGFRAVAYTDATKALAAAKMTGGFDAIVVRSRLSDLTTFQVLDEIGRDVRTQNVKKIVMIEGAQPGDAEADYAKRNVAGYVPTAVDPKGVTAKVAEVLASAEGDAGRMRANAISIAASGALQGANGSTFNLKDAEGGLLEAAAEGRDEAVRVAALAALANCATPNAQNTLRATLSNSANSPAVRAGAAGALGRALRGAAPAPETFNALVESMADADAGVRNASGAALGQMKLSPEQSSTVLNKRRT